MAEVVCLDDENVAEGLRSLKQFIQERVLSREIGGGGGRRRGGGRKREGGMNSKRERGKEGEKKKTRRGRRVFHNCL